MNVITTEKAVGLVREAVGLIREARERPELAVVLGREVLPDDRALRDDAARAAELLRWACDEEISYFYEQTKRKGREERERADQA